MAEFTKVNKVINKERNPILPLPYAEPPVRSPLSRVLPPGKIVELAKIKIDLRHKPSGVLLYADVNWSAIFPSSAFTVGGWAETTFELLRDGSVICKVHQSALQGENDGANQTALTVFRNAVLRYFDTVPTLTKYGKVTYTLRAANIVSIDPNGDASESAKVNAGAVTLTAQQIDAVLPDNEQQ